MRSHHKHGCSGATPHRRRPPVLLLLLALAAAAAWFLRRRHVVGVAEADAWRDALPAWAGPSGTAAEPSGRREAAPAVEPVEPAVAAEGAPVPADEPPAAAQVAAPAAGDDLRRIEGIGPKIAAALVAAELGTYAAVAEASEGDLKAALREAGLRFAPSLPTWARQARLLADGDEEGFLALTDRLVAGRDEG
ncbi:hypothetical protein [Actinotalea sp.]|uniref:hypothetical protein n=1 Tax=Actinotalea sp. TaxID=1872145 RepID=UPI003564DE43